MNLGNLNFTPVEKAANLIGKPVKECLAQLNLNRGLWVSKIDPKLAGTTAFCEQYNVAKGISANCVIVEAKRNDKVWYAACMILATDRVDVNGVVRKQLEARKTSFASMENAVSLTGMEYGGITPIGVPSDWPILIDKNIIKQQRVIIGSGVRGSKILISTDILALLPNALVLAIAKS